MTWREIEVEAKSSDAGDLLETIGQALRKAGARPSASGSKLRPRPRHRLNAAD